MVRNEMAYCMSLCEFQKGTSCTFKLEATINFNRILLFDGRCVNILKNAIFFPGKTVGAGTCLMLGSE